MPQSPVTMVRQYGSKIEAETIRIRLAAAGIQAFVSGEDAGTALGMGGAATNRLVHVEVPEADYERAVAILEEDDRRILEAGPWICSRCREQNEAAFEVCWSCNKPRTGDDEQGRIGQQAAAKAPVGIDASNSFNSVRPAKDDGNPYRPVLFEPRSPSSRHRTGMMDDLNDLLGESARQCFRAAIVGTLVFPPLVSLYSVLLLLRLGPNAFRRNAQVRIAWCINLVNIPAWTIFWLGMLLS